VLRTILSSNTCRNHWSSIFLKIDLILFLQLSADGKPVAAKNADSCVESLWALLPSVCNFPVDTAAKFGYLAKTLGDALNKEKALRGLICSSLQVYSLLHKLTISESCPACLFVIFWSESVTLGHFHFYERILLKDVLASL
jgi:hypothetical protein